MLHLEGMQWQPEKLQGHGEVYMEAFFTMGQAVTILLSVQVPGAATVRRLSLHCNISSNCNCNPDFCSLLT
jgi:hypothetical protein